MNWDMLLDRSGVSFHHGHSQLLDCIALLKSCLLIMQPYILWFILLFQQNVSRMSTIADTQPLAKEQQILRVLGVVITPTSSNPLVRFP